VRLKWTKQYWQQNITVKIDTYLIHHRVPYALTFIVLTITGSYVVISLVICISYNIAKTDVTYMCWSCVWLYKIFDNEM
jgi:hypothetical protein